MIRRAFSLPYPAEAKFLASLLSGAEVLPEAPEAARLVAAASEHRVTGDLLEADAEDRVRLPADLRQQLLMHHGMERLRTAMLRRELALVRPVVGEACGAEPIVIKGPEVAERFYPDRRLRAFRDLDFVVPPDRMRAAAQALQAELGYFETEEPWSGFGERSGHHLTLARRQAHTGTVVELHWRVSDDPVAEPLAHSRLLAGAVRVSIPDAGEVAVPRLEDELLVLSLHLLHEPVKCLLWVNDLALAAGAASESEWLGAFASARDLNLGWVLDRGLEYAARHLGFQRERPWGPGRPPPWGPLRAGERLEGWIGFQVGRLALGGWADRDGYLRSAARARLARLSGSLRPLRKPR